MDAEASGNESVGWVDLGNHKKQLRAILIRYGLMRKDSQTPNFYHITDKGRDELMRPVSARVATQKRKAKVSTLYEGSGQKPVVVASGQEAVKTQVRPFSELVAEACKPDGCDGQCVYRQVVEILAARVPGTNELVEALKLLNKAR